MTSRHAQRRSVALALAAAGSLALSACGGGSGFSSQSTATQKAGPANLKIMIGSSGDAETAAVKAAADSWAKKSGNTVEVIAASGPGPAARSGLRRRHPAGRLLHRRLHASVTSPRRATSTPTATRSRTPASCPPGADLHLRRQVPLRAEGLLHPGLVINTDLWTKAGLTDADIPKDWAGLEAVAKKLTQGQGHGPGHRQRHQPRRSLHGRPAAGW